MAWTSAHPLPQTILAAQLLTLRIQRIKLAQRLKGLERELTRLALDTTDLRKLRRSLLLHSLRPITKPDPLQLKSVQRKQGYLHVSIRRGSIF